MMRIITGTARGVKLDTLEGDATRPTSERVKEGIFSALQFDIKDRKVLDLFAGTGQLGLEALSRGAEKAVFVDSSRDAVSIIKRNAQKAGLMGKCNVLEYTCADYIRAAGKRRSERFGLIFMDPPYDTGGFPELLRLLNENSLYARDCIVVCENEEPDIFSDLPSTLPVHMYRQYRYGRTFVTVLKSAAD